MYQAMICELSSLVSVHSSKEKIQVKKLVLGLILLSGLLSANAIAAGLKVGVVSVASVRNVTNCKKENKRSPSYRKITSVMSWY
jgi:hypothetical protein